MYVTFVFIQRDQSTLPPFIRHLIALPNLVKQWDIGDYIVDLYLKKDIGDLHVASDVILRIAGVVEHGMFLDIANTVIVVGERVLVILKKMVDFRGKRNIDLCSRRKGSS